MRPTPFRLPTLASIDLVAMPPVFAGAPRAGDSVGRKD
jgi:hypothetical protein